MRAQLVERLELGASSVLALERDELFLEYQPLVELRPADHRRRGADPLAAPDARAACARPLHRAGRVQRAIVAIGRWVLQTACAQLRRWQDEHPAPQDLQMSVNVSTRQLADPDLPAVVRAALDAAGIDPSRSRSRSPSTCCSTTAT